MRRDDLGDDALSGRVGQRAFEAVADLDAHGVVFLGDHQQRTVIDLLAAQLPLLGHAQRILLDALGRGAGQHEHRDLRALARLEFGERLLDIGFFLAGERGGEIEHIALELRHKHFDGRPRSG